MGVTTKIIAALIALAAFCGFIGAVYYEGRVDEHDKAVAEQAAADRRAQLERDGDDAKLKNLSTYDLCVTGLRGNGMRDDVCDELRGTGEK